MKTNVSSTKRKTWTEYLPYVCVNGALIDDNYDILLLVPKVMHHNTFNKINYDYMISPFERYDNSLIASNKTNPYTKRIQNY